MDEDLSRRITYAGGAVFIPKCEKCGKYVKPDKSIKIISTGLKDEPNATCSKCGRTKMLFEGFFAGDIPDV